MKYLKISILALAVLFFPSILRGQTSPTVNVTFRSKMGFGMACANICGYAANGREYALVGNFLGVAIVDVTNPDVPVNLQPRTRCFRRDISIIAIDFYLPPLTV